MDGSHGIEEILFVEEQFCKIARQLKYTQGRELFDNFEEILTELANTKWNTFTEQIVEADKTVDWFNEAVKEYYLKFVQSDAQDVSFTYLDSIHKKVHTTVKDHATRYTNLYHYLKLPGLEPERNADVMKVKMFKSFPQKWQQLFLRAGKSVADKSFESILNYMSNEASFVDAEQEQSKLKAEGDGNLSSSKRPRGGRNQQGCNCHSHLGTKSRSINKKAWS